MFVCDIPTNFMDGMSGPVYACLLAIKRTVYQVHGLFRLKYARQLKHLKRHLYRSHFLRIYKTNAGWLALTFNASGMYCSKTAIISGSSWS